MADQDDVKISQLTALLLLDDGSYIPVIQTLNGTLTTLKVDVSTFAGKIAEGTTYTNLTTTSKNLVGAINEVKAQTGGKFIIVETLPTEDIDLKAIYLILKTGSEPNNVYDEYLYINNAWELIGTTAVDLSNYYTKSQTDTEIEQAITVDTYSGLQTTNKTVVGAINECFGTWLTATLTAGSTSITLQAPEITTTSTIDIYTDTFGIQPTNAVVATGTITLTFLAQASDIVVKVRVS